MSTHCCRTAAGGLPAASCAPPPCDTSAVGLVSSNDDAGVVGFTSNAVARAVAAGSLGVTRSRVDCASPPAVWQATHEAPST